MNRGYIFIAIEWIVTICLLVKFIHKSKIREASVAFCFNQFLTWILGLTVVQFKLIEYPVRLFPYATKANFTFEYFVYPSLCAIFTIPKKKRLRSVYVLLLFLYYNYSYRSICRKAYEYFEIHTLDLVYNMDYAFYYFLLH